MPSTPGAAQPIDAAGASAHEMAQEARVTLTSAFVGTFPLARSVGSRSSLSLLARFEQYGRHVGLTARRYVGEPSRKAFEDRLWTTRDAASQRDSVCHDRVRESAMSEQADT